MTIKAIETHNLTKFYGKARGICELNLEVEPGEIFGFIGPNGAGKSTTIKTLLNFIHPTSGSASILGLDVVRDTVQIKQKVGYIPSEVSYYDDMTAEQLLNYSASFYSVDCHARRNQLADQLEVELGRKIDDLSLGNRKKVAIVQALQHQPEVIILDEPTSGLDPLMQARFFEILQEENRRGATVFFSSHILSEVQRLCHRVAIIKEGRLVRVETVERLRRSSYKRVRLQATDQVNLAELPGVQDVVRQENYLEFLYGGNLQELLAVLASQEIADIWREDPSLEDVFMHYYEREGAEQ